MFLLQEEKEGNALIEDNWLPTSENINRLPEPLRRYIMHLETNADPAGNIQKIWALEQQLAGLQLKLTIME